MLPRPSSPRRSLIALAALSLLVGACVQDPLPVAESREVELTDDNFKTLALDSDKMVLVEFGASWCGPCRQMEPVLAALSVDYQDRLTVGKVDADESLQLTRDYEIEALPTLLLLQGGEVVAREMGAMSYQELGRWVDEHLPK